MKTIPVSGSMKARVLLARLKPKITRLNDPNNPYGGVKTPTRARTESEKVDAGYRSRDAPARVAPVKPAEKPDSQYMEARKRFIDRAVDRATK